MDAKCVRVLRPYEEKKEKTIYIDEDARYSLMAQWGDHVTVKGRRDVKRRRDPALKTHGSGGLYCPHGEGAAG